MSFSTLPPEWEAALSTGGVPLDLPRLYSGVDQLYRTHVGVALEVYPNRHLLFRAYHETPPDAVRVLVIGQDPYPQELEIPHPSDPLRTGVADGLAFSASGLPITESLIRIIWNLWITGELLSPPRDGSLLRWAAEEGVLLLNAALTVAGRKSVVGRAAREHSLETHKRVWEPLILSTLAHVSANFPHTVVLLMGKHAERFEGELTSLSPRSICVVNHPSRGPWPSARYTQTPFVDLNKHLDPALIDWSL